MKTIKLLPIFFLFYISSNTLAQDAPEAKGYLPDKPSNSGQDRILKDLDTQDKPRPEPSEKPTHETVDKPTHETVDKPTHEPVDKPTHENNREHNREPHTKD